MPALPVRLQRGLQWMPGQAAAHADHAASVELIAYGAS
jgi:hypothetical protein